MDPNKKVFLLIGGLISLVTFVLVFYLYQFVSVTVGALGMIGILVPVYLVVIFYLYLLFWNSKFRTKEKKVSFIKSIPFVLLYWFTGLSLAVTSDMVGEAVPFLYIAGALVSMSGAFSPIIASALKTFSLRLEDVSLAYSWQEFFKDLGAWALFYTILAVAFALLWTVRSL